jgi:hypothetical protein
LFFADVVLETGYGVKKNPPCTESKSATGGSGFLYIRKNCNYESADIETTRFQKESEVRKNP